MFSHRFLRHFIFFSCLIGLFRIAPLQSLVVAQESAPSSQSSRSQPSPLPAVKSNGDTESKPSLAAPLLGGEAVQVIYVVPMKNKMERFLIRELAKWGRFQVTLKAGDADALLSDSPNINVQEILQGKAAAIRTNEGKPGNVFLISRQTEKVLWATGESTTSHNPLAGPKTLEGLAEGMIGNLRHDVNAWDKKVKKEEAAEAKP